MPTIPYIFYVFKYKHISTAIFLMNSLQHSKLSIVEISTLQFQ